MTRRGESARLPDVGTLNPPTPELARHAALIACDASTDLDDARQLVDMLIDREWLA